MPKWDLKQFLVFGLFLITMDLLWNLGLAGKVATGLVFVLWCLWVWRTIGYDRKGLLPLLAVNGIFFALWVFHQYQPVRANILAVPIIVFSGYM